MRDTYTVFRKELKSYVVSPIPYVFLTIFTAFAAWWCFWLGDGQFFVANKASLDSAFFSMIPIMLVCIVPAISMRLWSEEVRSGTIEQLMTLPVRTHALVLGKFLAAWAMLLVALLLTCTLPITVAMQGDLDWGPVIAGYTGAWFFGGALLALGLWISALTHHQIVAFLVTLVVGFGITMLERTRGAPGSISGFLTQISPATHYRSMGLGVIELRDVVYFLSFIFFFAYLNVQAIENRRVR